MKIDVYDDVVDRLVALRLKDIHETMTAYLERYEQPNPGWIAVFDTDLDSDKKAIKKFRKQVKRVLDYFGEKV